MTSEAMVRHVVGVEGAQALCAIVEGAWQDYLDEGRPRFHRTTRANIVWDYMVQRSDELPTGMEGVSRVDRHDRPLYLLRDLFAIRPKMHDRESLTRNYPTAAQSAATQTGLFPGIDVPIISFGYKLDAAEAGIEQLLITSPADDWIIDLQELALGAMTPVQQIFELPDMDIAWHGLQPIRYRRAG